MRKSLPFRYFRKPNENNRTRLTFEPLEDRHLLAADPIITEFMASNDATINDGFGDDSDWIEIYNAGDMSVDLQGYHLTDNQSDLAKWTFPESTVLDAGEYLIVFASSADTQDPEGYWHTNFKLGASGEYVALTDPGSVVLSQFDEDGSDYPAQFTDIAYGLSGTQLVDGESVSRYFIPPNGNLGSSWRAPGFDAAANGFALGRASLGYEDSPGSSTSYSTLIETMLPTETTSVYVRTEFSLSDASSISELSLNLLYDDGVVVYLNGMPVFSGEAPTNPQWNSVSTGGRDDADVLDGIDVSLDSSVLQDGTNVLAFHMLNDNAASSDFLLVPTLTANFESPQPGYLQNPTPGSANSAAINLGPSIRDVELLTTNPVANQALVIAAEVSPTLAPLAGASVALNYRVGFGSESQIIMRDDGTGGDVQAGDGIFTATIPGAAAGQLVRWYVTADDSQGEQGRAPLFLDPLDSAEYFGTVIEDPTVSADLPVFQWFVEDTAAAQTREGTRASLFLNGELYDNIQVDLHGQTTAGPDFPKKSFDFDSNKGQKFKFSDDYDRASDFNLLTNYGDESKLRHSLANDAFAASGGGHNLAFPVSVYRNGSFFGLYDFVEEGDSESLERLGLDPEGAFYKVNNPLNSAYTEVDKMTRKDENNDDLQELVNAVNLTGTAARRWDYDNLDVADLINYVAVNSVVLNLDYGHKNMYWYLDTNGSGLWSALPWDVDLSFGHAWSPVDGYFDDTLVTTGGVEWSLNSLFQRIYTDPRMEAMYYARLRTLADQMLGTAGTDPEATYFGQQITQLTSAIADEAIADEAIWGRHPNFSDTPSSAADQLLNVFISARRNYIESRPQLPDAHTSTANITIADFDYAPASGNIEQQYVRLMNNESFAVDISGWNLGGSTDHAFKAGTVISANSSLYLVSDVVGFQARTTGPGAGQQLFIQQNGAGTFNASGGSFQLTNADGISIDDETYGNIFDFDGDGSLGCGDINALSSAIASNATGSLFDVTGDGSVNIADLDAWRQFAGETNLGVGQIYPAGDANLDGVTDGVDFSIWSANKFTTNSAWCSGDFNASGTVDGHDFLIWNANKTVVVSTPAHGKKPIAKVAEMREIDDDGVAEPSMDRFSRQSFAAPQIHQNDRLLSRVSFKRLDDQPSRDETNESNRLVDQGFAAWMNPGFRSL